MGFIKNIIKGQLIDVIEWKDNTLKTMVYRFDNEGKEIMMGSQLIVRESQLAIFVNEGEIADMFTPGRYELTTQNMPVMTMLKSWKFGFNSPFKAEVYFLNTKQFRDCKWGTTNPVMMRDKEFGMIRLRAFGIYSFRIADPQRFLKEVFGTNSYFTSDDVEGQIKRTIVSSLSDSIAESNIAALDLAANYEELSSLALNNISPKIADLGLQLESFIIENISLPEEVEKTMDKRTSMGVLGDLNQYTKYQAAEAMREAANADGGGIAGMGVGMGAGAMMGQMFTQSMQNSQNQQNQPTQQNTAPTTSSKPCINCGAIIPQDARFCIECGTEQTAKVCSNCGNPLQANTKFCSNCGQKLI